MWSLTQMEKDGFEGIDVSLAISLYEYGLAWHNTNNWEVINSTFTQCYACIYGYNTKNEFRVLLLTPDKSNLALWIWQLLQLRDRR